MQGEKKKSKLLKYPSNKNRRGSHARLYKYPSSTKSLIVGLDVVLKQENDCKERTDCG